MKKGWILAILSIAVLNVTAQSDKYTKAMEARLTAMDTVKSAAGWRSLADAFQRIGDAEKTQWLPYYYAALCLLTPAWTDPAIDKDTNATRVKELCAKAEAIEDNAELCTIRNMAATQQMLVDPQSRWSTYGAESEAAMKKGLQLDPNNPRLYYLQGAGIFGTPEQFGGGKAKAKPVLEKALSLFNAEDPKPLYPRWGKQLTEEMLAQCK
ncbi:MAG: hypothetical protein KF746_00270 [Chitinophagaceae bacterium]|nr:hypothetical protein [Chitinophagaceae bacterium]